VKRNVNVTSGYLSKIKIFTRCNDFTQNRERHSITRFAGEDRLTAGEVGRFDSIRRVRSRFGRGSIAVLTATDQHERADGVHEIGMVTVRA